jgi:hypothetical protein
MANYGPSSAFILVGGYNLTGDHYSLDETLEQILDQTNALGDSWEEHTPVGIGRASIDPGAGLYDDRAAGQLAAYQSMGTTRQLVALGFAGYAVGAPCNIYSGTYAATWKRTTTRANLTLGNATHRISGARIPAQVIHGIAARTAAGDNEVSDIDAASLAKSVPISASAVTDVFTFTEPHGLAVGDKVLFVANHTSTPDPDGNTYVVATVPTATTATFTGLDITVAGTGGSIKRVGIASASADLHAMDVVLGGYDNWIITLRHSDDGVTWSDAVVFTAVTAANVSERKAVSNLKRYRAVSYALTGAGSSPSIKPFVAAQV